MIKIYIKRIKDLREDHDIKQREIAEYLNITQQQYSLYEKGIRTIPIDLIIELAKFYNVTIDYIAGLTNDPKPNWSIKNNVNVYGGDNKFNFE